MVQQLSSAVTAYNSSSHLPQRIGGTRGTIVSLVDPEQVIFSGRDFHPVVSGRFLLGRGGTAGAFLYLAVVIDAGSRRVVGWAMASHLRTEWVLDALNMALAQRHPEDVIHHSD